MWNRLLFRNASITSPSTSSSQPLSEVEAKLSDLEIAPPSPSIMRGGTYETAPVSIAESTTSEALQKPFRILDLPPELIDQVLNHLSPVSLAQVACACRTLHSHAYDERQWIRISRQLRLPASHELPSPFSNWREFYSAHYPFWFLPQRKLWFADKATRGLSLTGQLTLARYDYRMGNIELYRVYAKNLAMQQAQQWSWNPDVLIHAFTPCVQLLLDDPIVKLEVGMYERGGRMKKEVHLTRGYERSANGLQSRLFLARPVPPKRQAPNMALWPPKTVPAIDRVRNESSTLFHDLGHKPSCYEELSETTFRTRVWTEFVGFDGGLAARMGEDVITFSTLPESCYSPTEEKPYQGIWVGDYSGHGCEFLLVTQKTIEEAATIPPIVGMSDEDRERMMRSYHQHAPNGNHADVCQNQREERDPPGCSGRLEAVKLCGDVNVPRGEITFVAEDIGHRGLLRRAQEYPFKGARVVKCWGHVASRGFIDDGYIPSQLIMISHDCLAQYWEEFGHISYFKRLNIDQFLDVETAPIEGVVL